MIEPTEITQEKPTLDPRITVEVKMPDAKEAGPHEVFMSAGLIRRLTAIINSLGEMSQMYSDPMVEDVLLVEVLSPRTERGKTQKIYTGEDFEMTMEEADRLLEWVRGHILDFFTKTVLRVGTEATNPNSQIQKLMQSLNGLAALMQEKQSAGPSTAKSVT